MHAYLKITGQFSRMHSIENQTLNIFRIFRNMLAHITILKAIIIKRYQLLVKFIKESASSPSNTMLYWVYIIIIKSWGFNVGVRRIGHRLVYGTVRNQSLTVTGTMISVYTERKFSINTSEYGAYFTLLPPLGTMAPKSYSKTPRLSPKGRARRRHKRKPHETPTRGPTTTGAENAFPRNSPETYRLRGLS